MLEHGLARNIDDPFSSPPPRSYNRFSYVLHNRAVRHGQDRSTKKKVSPKRSQKQKIVNHHACDGYNANGQHHRTRYNQDNTARKQNMEHAGKGRHAKRSECRCEPPDGVGMTEQIRNRTDSKRNRFKTYTKRGPGRPKDRNRTQTNQPTGHGTGSHHEEADNGRADGVVR